MIRLALFALRFVIGMAGALVQRPEVWDGPTYGTAPGPMPA